MGERTVETAEQLFKISKDLIEVDETLSQLTLFVADAVLKVYEKGSKRPTQTIQPGMEVCKDCGGVKPIGEPCQPNMPEGMEECKDCGGMKPIGEECQPQSSSTFQSPSLTLVDKTTDDPEQQCRGHQNDPEQQCHGHMADGSGVDPNYTRGGQSSSASQEGTPQDRKEVSDLVEKIRSELKGD